MRRPHLLPIVCAIVLQTACASNESTPADALVSVGRTLPDAVHAEGAVFRDGQGRQLLFRGYNIKVPGLFDVTFEDGRTANEVIVPFTDEDASRVEQLGLNVVRLAINWSALEPHPGEFSTSFLENVEAILGMARRHRFRVFFDLHQDAYSKEIGQDGAPLWAIVPPPKALLQGPYDDGRRMSADVLNATFSFFDNKPATDGRLLQDAFSAAVVQLVRRYSADPVVLGWEAFNEPFVLDHRTLDEFHARFADAVHAVDSDAPVLFEPIATRNQSDKAIKPQEPWAHGPGVYAPHIYTAWFSRPDQGGWASENPADLIASMQAASEEAAAWGTPLFITEFGCDQNAERGPRWLAAELDLQDRFLASSTAWVWREAGSWGLSDNERKEHAATATVMARVWPRAVAGDLLAIERSAPGHLLVRWRENDRARGLPHEIALPFACGAGCEIRCDGVSVPFTPSTGSAEFTCPLGAGDRTFEVVGTPPL